MGVASNGNIGEGETAAGMTRFALFCWRYPVGGNNLTSQW